MAKDSKKCAGVDAVEEVVDKATPPKKVKKPKKRVALEVDTEVKQAAEVRPANKSKKAKRASEPTEDTELMDATAEAVAPRKKKLKSKNPKEETVDAAEEDMPGDDEWKDKWLACMDCNEEFCLSVDDQNFFNEKGFDPPKRCKDCRWAKKQRNESGDGGKGKGKVGKDGKGKGKGKNGKDKGKKGGGGGVCYKF